MEKHPEFLMNKTKNTKVVTYAIHLIIWMIVFCFPLITSERTGDTGFNWHKYLVHSIVPFSFLIVYYINTALLIPRLLFKNRRIQYILSNLVFILVLSWGIGIWHRVLIVPYYPKYEETTASTPAAVPGQANSRYPSRPRKGPGLNPPDKMSWFLLRDIISLGFIAGLAATIKMSERWSTTEKSLRIAQEQKTEAELSNLRNQLNPHFLLNTLNNIYSLIAIDQDKAQEAVHQLSKLLRHMLYDNREMFIPLAKEAEFLTNYIELMKIRLSAQCDIQIDIQIGPNSPVRIAPLIFISLIENAFKHGISPTRASFIHLALYEKKSKVIYTIQNSFYPKNQEDKSGSGIGLNQVQTRLDLLYPGKYHWEYGVDPKDNIYSSHLEIETV